MKKVRIGVLGGYRGTSMINYCKRSDNAEVVAICDKNPDVIEAQKGISEGLNITFYDDFDNFINHDMDAVVLANYAHEHAPFAIRALKRGLHVFSEVVPAATMKEAVELIEAVEESGKVYAYGENYCYMSAPYEMRRLYKEGKIGEFEYGEGEYIHNCESIWPSLTYGERDHWRNNMSANFYCTHSLGPIIHITGLRPVSVVGYEGANNERKLRTGAKSASFGMEMVTLENGAIVKSVHGALYTHNIWYTVYGSKGSMESGREAFIEQIGGGINRISVRSDEYSGKYDIKNEVYEPEYADSDKIKGFGHGGSDFFSMYHFVEKILGNPEADIIDVYEAMDMWLPGLFAHRSVLEGNVLKEIPNLRVKSVREEWRNDVACTFPEIAGDALLPTCQGGTPDIDDGVYEHMKQLWDIERNKKEGSYRTMAFVQGSKK
ncbi:MAG: Gfo/Idh/MocA family oxidoreductase [Clostridia bacterium]|nr:Gfo/Idh/MocA family oxidoreductase [Clostridia bacterium]